jgi:isochorismate hydrolase
MPERGDVSMIDPIKAVKAMTIKSEADYESCRALIWDWWHRGFCILEDPLSDLIRAELTPKTTDYFLLEVALRRCFDESVLDEAESIIEQKWQKCRADDIAMTIRDETAYFAYAMDGDFRSQPRSYFENKYELEWLAV